MKKKLREKIANFYETNGFPCEVIILNNPDFDKLRDECFDFLTASQVMKIEKNFSQFQFYGIMIYRKDVVLA